MVLKPAWGQHDEFHGNTLCRVAYRGMYGYVDAGRQKRASPTRTPPPRPLRQGLPPCS